MIRLLKEIKKLVVGSVLTLSGAIMMTSAENIAVIGMVVGLIGLLFLVISLLSALSLLLITKRRTARSRNQTAMQNDNY